MKHLQRLRRTRPRVLTLLGISLLAALGLQPAAASGEPADNSAVNTRPAAGNPKQTTSTRAVPASAAATPSSAPASSSAPRVATTEPAKQEPATARKKARTPNRPQARSKPYQRKRALAQQQTDERAVAEGAVTPTSKGSQAARIAALLAAAKRDYDAGRLIAPLRNNAAEAYREVLALDPTQLDALAGARRIVSIIAAEAERTAAAGDRGRTQQYIAAIRALQPQDPALLELEARLQTMTESPVVLSVRQQERYGRSAENIERAYEALQRQPLDKRAIDAALAEYDRARALVAQAPGLPLLKDRIIVAFPAATQHELARDNARRALQVVELARQRGWLTPELEALETTAQSDSPSN